MGTLFFISKDQLVALEKVRDRLYNETRLSGDERRDLANRLYAILNTVRGQRAD